MAAFSTPRRNSRARSLSIFWPKLLAFAAVEVLNCVSVAMKASSELLVASCELQARQS
jgi:hypothetical protein